MRARESLNLESESKPSAAKSNTVTAKTPGQQVSEPPDSDCNFDSTALLIAGLEARVNCVEMSSRTKDVGSGDRAQWNYY